MNDREAAGVHEAEFEEKEPEHERKFRIAETGLGKLTEFECSIDELESSNQREINAGLFVLRFMVHEAKEEFRYARNPVFGDEEEVRQEFKEALDVVSRYIERQRNNSYDHPPTILENDKEAS